MANKGGFSWKRAVGITKAKQNFSRKTGIPLTKSGRQQKVGRIVTGGGCLIPTAIFVFIFVFLISITAFANEAKRMVIIVDGKQMKTDVPPSIENGRALIPAAALYKALGASVTWGDAIKTLHIKLNDTNMSLQINNSEAICE